MTNKLIKYLAIPLVIFGISNKIDAQDNKQDDLVLSGNINAGISSRNILISGKPEGESPIALFSGNLGFTKFNTSLNIFGGLNQDYKKTREIDLGLSYQKKFNEMAGKPSIKVNLERKVFPDIQKTMYLADLIVGMNTKIGDFNLQYRERFPSKDYLSGSTFVLNAKTPSLNLKKIASMDANINGTLTVAYQDKFVGNSSKFGYITPGVNFSLKKGKVNFDGFLKSQIRLRDDLKNYVYGGVKATYSFIKK
jgi:hypothetical protein